MSKTLILATGIFLVMLGVYWKSVPHAFNTVYENRRFFDSDGEFIVRQYRQNRTFTHNDHLLYHVLGRVVQKNSKYIPGLRRDVVRSHQFLSAVAGALGVVFLYLAGLRLTSRHPTSLLAALAAGGTAGWWFFSSTIDTYLPCLCASVAALWVALTSLREPSVRRSAWLGGLIGLAFLLRTDSFLLAVLGLVLFHHPANRGKRIGAAVAAGILVGGGGYFLLAHYVYDVPWTGVPAWALGGVQRPEAAQEGTWGGPRNLSWGHLLLVAVNHLFYTVLLPGLGTTREPIPTAAYSGPGFLSLAVYGTMLTAALVFALGKLWTAWRVRDVPFLFLAAIGVLWFGSRLIFYVWWDPFDPFLFAVMNIPPLWLLCVVAVRHALRSHSDRRRQQVCLTTLAVLTALVWVHNYMFLIRPLRALSG